MKQDAHFKKHLTTRNPSSRFKELELFAEVIPDGVIIIDKELVIEAVNESGWSLLGLPEQAIGRTLDDCVKSDALNGYLRSKSQSDPLEFTSPVQKDSTLELRVFEVDNDSKVLIVRDITTQNRLLTMRQSFVANVSHELRTPLTVVKGYLETINDPTSPIDLRLALIDKLTAPVARMESLVQDLLLLTQLESNPVPPEMDEINMAGLMVDASNEVQGLLKKQDSLVINKETDAKIKGIASELTSVCINLISNAIRYSPDGAQITVSWSEPQHGKARLTVKDEGLGIAKEHLDRITERFYRVDMKDSRTRGGTGLGLAIVKHVLRRHNSELKVESKLNMGSLFYCDFDVTS